MIRIIFCGSHGKMGSYICQKLKLRKDYLIVDEVNKDSSLLESVINLNNCDVVVDFTNAKAGFYHGVTALTHNCHFVSGSTGIDTIHLKQLDKMGKEYQKSVLVCPNFTKGIRLISNYMDRISSVFPSLSLEEEHHESKLDAPSGTAKMLASKFEGKVSIISKRSKKKVAIHKLIFTDESEKLTIKHEVKNKDAYLYYICKAIDDCGKYSGLKETI